MVWASINSVSNFQHRASSKKVDNCKSINCLNFFEVTITTQLNEEYADTNPVSTHPYNLFYEISY